MQANASRDACFATNPLTVFRMFRAKEGAMVALRRIASDRWDKESFAAKCANMLVKTGRGNRMGIDVKS
jgi:hypothetical protein